MRINTRAGECFYVVTDTINLFSLFFFLVKLNFLEGGGCTRHGGRKENVSEEQGKVSRCDFENCFFDPSGQGKERVLECQLSWSDAFFIVTVTFCLL